MSLPVLSFRDIELPGFGPARLIEFEIPGGPCTPGEFAAAIESQPPDFFSPPGRGVIFSGRGPVWGYGMLLHAAHPTRWTATIDPRLGAVIVQSHVPGIQAGRLIFQEVLDQILKGVK